LSKVPAVSHEGLRFDKDGTLYFIDESNTGCLYKYVPKVPGNLGVGQSYALRVTAYTGDPTLNWDSNLTSPRVGAATWVPITDIDGNKLTVADPFQYNATISSGGRAAGDEVFCTPYGRPEDMAISTDKDGKEVMYVSTTSENAVYAVVLLSNTTAEVKVFCNRNTINIATGLPVGGNFSNPDNLAIDFGGTIYVVEDEAPPTLDIWQAVDADNNGVAEYLALWMTSGVTGSENTGLMFHPNEVNTAIVAVQHPSSGNDAIWEIKYNIPNKTENIPDLTSKTALNASKVALPIGGVEENTIPFNTPAGYTYRKITDVRTLNSTGAWPRGFTNWDMVAYAAPEGALPGSYPNAERYLFIPMETSEGGLARYDTVDGTYLILARGNNSFPRNPNPATFDVTKDNFQSTDPATFTPFNTVLFAEETTGKF
jgi:secreted PhoX family phosphatase